MNKAIFTQQLFLLKQDSNNNKLLINDIKYYLEKQNILIISGLKNIWKLSTIKQYILDEHLENNFFYFNSKVDFDNNIKNNKKLEKLLNDYIEHHKKPTIIILENFSKIKWIKNFIRKIIEENYKIILVWNNIKIPWIKDIEIFNQNKGIWLYETLKYGQLNDIVKIEDKPLKEKYINFLINDVYMNEIIWNFWIKNIVLYNYIITFLANNNIFYSLRELQREIIQKENISLKTLIDYINFSIKSKLIKQVYRYDLKKDKIITTKSKFYFIDNWIRNSYKNFNLETSVLLENYIFLILLNKWYKIYSGKNGKFEFDFIAEKIITPPLKSPLTGEGKNTSSQSSLNTEQTSKEQRLNNMKKYFHISKSRDKKK